MMKMNKSTNLRTLFTLGSVLFGVFSSVASAQYRDDYRQDDYGDIRQTVARISFLSGEVSFSRGDDPDYWQAADRNVPMTLGDRIYTGSRSRVELQIRGGELIRLGGRTDFAALDLTEDSRQFSLTSGVASVRIRRLSRSEIFEIDTPNAAVTFEEPGDYRVDVDQEGFTRVAVRDGSATVAAGGGQISLVAGEAMEIDGIDYPRYDIVGLYAPDGWDRWVSQRDDRRRRARSYNYVSADIVGADDLDEYGRWEQVRDYGWVWSPRDVSADWAPYRSGHWVWQDPWGWTWVSSEPWGWAPYHYGRWTRISSRWCWVPVAPTRSVRYAPALVAFVGGGPGWSLSVSIGGGGFVGWFPLGPRDSFSPWWGSRSGSRYPSVRNVTYSNRSYVTVVNQNVFVSGGLVSGNVLRDRAFVSQVAAAPVVSGPIPVVPTRQSLRLAVRPEAKAAPQPPAQTASRMVVARTAPPPPPPTFQEKLSVISQSRGAPVAPADAQRITVERRGRQTAPEVRAVAEQPGRVTLSPKDEGSEKATERRAQPVTASRGRKMATPQNPVSPAPDAAPARPAVAPPVVEEVPVEQPVRPAPPARQPQPDRGRDRNVVPEPRERPVVEPSERGRPQPPPESPQAPPPPPRVERGRPVPPSETPVPAPPPPAAERARPSRPADLPPGLERRRERPTAVPAPPAPAAAAPAPPPAPAPEPNLERGRGRSAPPPEPERGRDARPEVRREVAPPPAAPPEPEKEVRQPVERGRGRPQVTPTPENPKEKKDKKDKKPD
jgi:uncharacterized protein DUF6600/FecR-like protein